jgi:peptidoglycan hydrolase-like protein with peptidoglycan-binding domain
MKNMKKILAITMVVMSVLAVTVPAMALSGSYFAATDYLSYSTLKVGYGTVRAVTNLQYMLVALGYNPGSIDGVYGSLTASAVSDFQGDHNLSVDGQCGRSTKTKIWEELDELPAGCY